MDGSIGYWNKKKINELVKGCPLDMNGMNTSVDLNIIPVSSYDVFIEMDQLDAYHLVLDWHDKSFTCLDDEGEQKIVKGIPNPISIREFSSLQLKRCFKKGWQLYATYVQEPEKCKGPSLEYFQYYKILQMCFEKYQDCH